jgi:Protein of unknown function (DUF3105)
MSGRRRLTIVAAVILAGLVLAGAAVYRWASQDNSGVIPPPLAGVTGYDVQHGQNHTKGTVQYPQILPVGGPHNPKWQNCGFYGGTVQNELAVHSLEHGAVWITYRAPLPEQARQALIELAKSNKYVLVSAYDNLPALFVVSAWRYQLRLDSYDKARIDEFVRVFSGGTTAPEPVASCRGGVGRPDAY